MGERDAVRWAAENGVKFSDDGIEFCNESPAIPFARIERVGIQKRFLSPLVLVMPILTGLISIIGAVLLYVGPAVTGGKAGPLYLLAVPMFLLYYATTTVVYFVRHRRNVLFVQVGEPHNETVELLWSDDHRDVELLRVIIDRRVNSA